MVQPMMLNDRSAGTITRPSNDKQRYSEKLGYAQCSILFL